MNARKLADDFNEALQRDLTILTASVEWQELGTIGVAAIQMVRKAMRATANNLATGYADSIQEEPDERLHGPL